MPNTELTLKILKNRFKNLPIWRNFVKCWPNPTTKFCFNLRYTNFNNSLIGYTKFSTNQNAYKLAKHKIMQKILHRLGPWSHCLLAWYGYHVLKAVFDEASKNLSRYASEKLDRFSSQKKYISSENCLA